MRNSETFILAAWEGSVGSKTGRVGWVRCQGKEQAEGTWKVRELGNAGLELLKRDHPGGTVGETGEDRLWKSAIGEPPQELY